MQSLALCQVVQVTKLLTGFCAPDTCRPVSCWTAQQPSAALAGLPARPCTIRFPLLLLTLHCDNCHDDGRYTLQATNPSLAVVFITYIWVRYGRMVCATKKHKNCTVVTAGQAASGTGEPLTDRIWSITDQ